mmetsp:Transcript_21768/g.21069  ORF Transcript_21768/g.21069 Transcript_21768/m.21069 type:complete len:211 (+) Transcript_21768:156-788(+)|eukprot:CAMPEP_0119035076 /NCGR_PEP_ID=MMETSP1177-20130426/2048_1 /TAXON_ID=2985 /ORGANISM="Ochromonas sp, Strain CCMP1899" /LENGTH=210 /DNA_ID=CAMNT_0006992973 /DNA_START=155 /DNA_END=790 /DNA_ORIENTATION=+
MIADNEDATKKIELRKSMQHRIEGLAMGEAIKAGLGGLCAGGALTFGLNKYNKNFSKLMSVSAKTSIPVMSLMMLFTWRYEVAMHNAQRHPEQWGLTDENVRENKILSMPIHHKLLNGLYDNPFTVITVMGAPIAYGVWLEQSKLHHLSFSQRVMQTRVFAQAGILVLALSTMAFRDYMNKNGRFPEPYEFEREANPKAMILEEAGIIKK